MAATGRTFKIKKYILTMVGEWGEPFFPTVWGGGQFFQVFPAFSQTVRETKATPWWQTRQPNHGIEIIERNNCCSTFILPKTASSWSWAATSCSKMESRNPRNGRRSPQEPHATRKYWYRSVCIVCCVIIISLLLCSLTRTQYVQRFSTRTCISSDLL